MSNKLSLELHKYQNFRMKFNNGEFGQQRFGQAFHDYFELHKMTNSENFATIYEKDGEEAKALISQTFEFV